MGRCASKLDDTRRRSTIYGRRNTLVIRPKINIDIGDCIDQQAWKGHTKVIFIFGGPGSGKGTIINNLMQMYGIHLVCCEDILLSRLYEIVCNKPNQVVTDGQKFSENATKEIMKYIVDNPSEVSRHWIFQLIEEEIAKCGHGEVILVDMVPNLKFLLRCNAFMEKDPSNLELEKFEEKFPIRFAINLELEKQHLINNIAYTHACTKGIPSKAIEKVTTSTTQSDEIDMSRTERRFNIYVNSVEEFVNYFNGKGKLLAVDTSTCDIEAVWLAIRDYVVEAEIATPIEGVEPVILFQMGERDFVDVDTERYPMIPIRCEDLAEDSQNASPATLLKLLVQTMRENAVESKTFLVDCKATLLCDKNKLKEEYNKNQLVFMEEEIGTLDFFLHGLRRRTQRKKSIARKNAQFYKTVTTSDNEALIFPLETDSDLCRMICIGYMYAK